VSASHSLEVARLVDLGWLEKKNYRNKCNIKFSSNESGRSYIPTIKSAILKGNVLVSVSEKGYANLFLCARCRNTASCSCGGKLQILGANSIPVCYICHTQNKDWRCSYCGDAKPYVISKGIDRNAEEIGRAIPKTSILISSGAKQIQSLPKGRHIVLATAGSEPAGQYSGIVLLDGEKIFNRPSLRAEELARLIWFASLCRSTENSEVFLSLPNSHPVVQSMLRFDSQSAAISELRNRELAKLPPFYRIALVSGEGPEISKFAGNLKMNGKYEVTGPIDIDKGQKKIIIRVSLPNGQELVDLLDDVTKVQGVKGKNIFKIRFDPYDL
jgi:primosomal protein N' (replication factor Y)